MFDIIRRIYNHITGCESDIDHNINIEITHASKITQTRQGVFVDGQLVYKNKSNVNLTINIHGNTDSVQVYTGDVHVAGSVGKNVVSSSGNIDVQLYVGGNITTSSGNVSCSIARGDIRTNTGNIHIGLN